MDKVKKRFLFFSIVSLIIIIFSLIAPYLTPNDPYETNVLLGKLAPCKSYPFGTDSLGRCVLSRVMVGAKTSIFSALVLVFITFAFGTLIGIISGYFGGIFDSILMRFVDILLAFPSMVLAIAVAGILGGGLINAMLALGLTAWTTYARLARSHVLAIKEEDFIKAAKINGSSKTAIMFKHLLPNIIGPLVVNATVQIGSTMMGIAGLSFLGLGVQVPHAEWGSMVSEARTCFQLAPWTVFGPGIAIIITIMIFNCFGDSVQNILDPKHKAKG
ncbi:ABC transporter permease [Anaeromicropila populeti]|uniref:Peptide/nickel transport system permease protein n=1 Tax=Anaeromicropila populeti TaxID=37658 RepID=A0A1I6IGW7_9FIRM|nr:ABC transporter permease [Anaeromicropila populeti]SFR65560.1 peptide/nickel transport system permease protein [Anaeromicropila populeti]